MDGRRDLSVATTCKNFELTMHSQARTKGQLAPHTIFSPDSYAMTA